MQEKMTLSRALRYKKRVIENIRNLESEIQENNSKVAETERECDPELALKIRKVWVNHLIELKLKIQEATRPIQRLILELAETKTEISFVSRIPTVHGVHRAHFRDEATLTYEAAIRKQEVNTLLTELRDRIDSLQTKIDLHNAETTITIDTPDLP